GAGRRGVAPPPPAHGVSVAEPFAVTGRPGAPSQGCLLAGGQYHRGTESPRCRSGRFAAAPVGVLGVINRKFSVRESDEITAGRQNRLHPEKQHVLLYVASYAERDVTVLGSKTGRVTPS